MIIGHVGIALAAKRRWGGVTLFVALLATFAPDMLRAPLALAGMHWKETNLYTHALPWCLGLTALAGILAWSVLRDRTAALVVVALVVSHLAVDMISGRKALWVNGPIGLNVEEFEQLELVIESALVLAGWSYLRTGPRTWATRRLVPWLLILVEAAVLAGSISQRPYATRCLASPIATCTERSLLTTKWNTTPFW